MGKIIPILFVVIAIVSGILNFIKEKKHAEEVEQMRERKKRQRDQAPNDELAQFLNEVSASGDGPQRRRRRKRPSQRDRAEERRRQREQAEAEEQSSRRRSRRKSGVVDRHLDTEELSSVRDQHLESKVESRHLESSVADQHLFEVDEGDLHLEEEVATHPIAEMLSQPGGIRNAILINEILQPSVSRRKR